MGMAQLKVGLRMISLPKEFILSADNAKSRLVEGNFPVTCDFNKNKRANKQKSYLIQDRVVCNKFFFFFSPQPFVQCSFFHCQFFKYLALLSWNSISMTHIIKLSVYSANFKNSTHLALLLNCILLFLGVVRAVPVEIEAQVR